MHVIIVYSMITMLINNQSETTSNIHSYLWVKESIIYQSISEDEIEKYTNQIEQEGLI